MDMEDQGVEERVQTFKDWPLDYLLPRQLAEAGFVYLGYDDAVRCHSCRNTLTQWEVGEEPWKEHTRLFPGCFFVQSRRPNVVQSVHSSLENRCKTFGIWPGQLVTVRPETLAEAGFCYCGVRDEVTCHCCLVTFHVARWKEGDDAWTKHFEYSPGCVYVLQHWPQVRDKMSTELHRFCSFTNWPRRNTIHVPSMVRAGLFYTGVSDQVECYLCHGRLVLWDDLDQPCQEHRRHFPHCPLSGECAYNRECDPHELDRGTHKSNVSYRLATFWNWPNHSSHGNLMILAAAGFMYTGKSDAVQCFSCGTILSKWEPNDHPWVEHLRLVPSCRHALCQAPLNVLLKTMAGVKERLASFHSWSDARSPIPVRALAEAGFFYCQTLDQVRCFRCGVLLYKWKPGEDPLREHSKHSPHCPFIQNQHLKEVFHLPSASVQSFHHDAAGQSRLINMGFTQRQIDHAVWKDPSFHSYELQQKIDFLLAVDLVAETASNNCPDSANSSSSTTVHPQPTRETSFAKNRRRSSSDSDRLLCKVCLDEEVSTLFMPCGHLSCCTACAPTLNDCPICRQPIQSRVRAIVS